MRSLVQERKFLPPSIVRCEEGFRFPSSPPAGSAGFQNPEYDLRNLRLRPRRKREERGRKQMDESEPMS